MSEISVTAADTNHVNQDDIAKRPVKPPKPKKWWKRLLLALLTLILALVVAAVWLLRTESGLQFALLRLPSWFGVDIRAQNVRGTLWQGFHGEKWQVSTEGADLAISRLEWDWAANELFSRQLHIKKLGIGDMHITTRPTPPKPEEDSTGFPDSLRLPLGIHIDEVSVGKITLEGQSEPLLNRARFDYHYTQGSPHRLNVGTLDSVFGMADGDVSLGESRPFATSAKLNLIGSRDGITVKGNAAVSGDLDNTTFTGRFAGEGVALDVNALLHPLAQGLNKQFDRVQVSGKGLNPQTVIPGLPQADLQLDFAITPIENSDALSGKLTLNNGKPLPLDGDGIPVQSVNAEFRLNDDGTVTLLPSQIAALKQGVLSAAGTVNPAEQQMDLNIGLAKLTLADIMNNPLKGTLDGTVALKGGFDAPTADWQLRTEKLNSTGRFALVTDREHGQQSLNISRARFATPDGGAVGVSGSMDLFGKQNVKLALVSNRFNPAALSPDYPKGNVNLDARVAGTLADNLQIRTVLDLGNSTLSGAALKGKGDVVFADAHLRRADVNITLDGNRIQTDGSIGKAGDKLNLAINAPRLDQFGFGLSGLLTAKGHIAGEPKKLDIDLDGQAQGLKFQDILNVKTLRFGIKASPDLALPLKVDVHGNALNVGGTAIEQVNLGINGTGHKHTIRADGNMAMDGKPYRLNVAANGGLNDDFQWLGDVSTLDIAGAFNAGLRNRLHLQAGSEKVAMSNASWSLMGGSLNLQNFVWQAGKGLTTKGNANGLDIRQIDNLVQLPVEQNVIIGGDWDLEYGENMAGFLRLNRQSGDIKLPARDQMLGLSRLQTDTRFSRGSINTKLDIVTQYARADGQINIGQNYGSDITRAPLSGALNVVVDDIARVRNFLPVGMEVTGRAQANVRLGGELGAPQLSGPFTGSNLSFLDRSSGLYLKNGSLQSHFSGQSWVIEGLTFREGAGSANLHGRVNLVGSDPDVDVKITLNRFEALSKPSQQLTLSGEANLLYLPVQGMTLTGLVKVDRARFDFPKSSAPSLSDDVIVVGRTDTKREPSTPINLDLVLDLNNAFRFNGQGLDVLMGGQLRLLAKPHQDVEGQGQIKVVRGRYKAYGQDLVIRRGTITFIDELTNPTLNIRAERRASPVGAGVEVTGSLDKPNTVLVADEAMSDKDKLSWLILGRPSSGDSDDAAIAAAAGAWLAGSINDKVGIVDNIGLETRRTRNAETGEMNAAEQVINVSKRLSNKLNVGYEYGLTSAESTVKLIYHLSRSFQAIGRVGTLSSGGEVRYTKRFD